MLFSFSAFRDTHKEKSENNFIITGLDISNMAHNFTNNIFDPQGIYLFTKCTQCGCRDDDHQRPARCPSDPNAAGKFV